AAFTALWLQAASATPSTNPKLDEARAQADDFEYAAALRTLDLALAVPGNDRETTLAILELQGIVWGNLNKGPKARTSFVTLLTLDPGRKLSGDHPPRVRTPFYEAKEIVERAGALALGRQPLKLEGGQVASVGVVISRDALKLVRQIRLHTQVADQQKVTTLTLDAAGKAQVPAVATEVRWWAEALGEKDAVLITLGTPEQPLIDSALVPPPEPPPSLPPVAIQAAQVPVAAQTPGWVRPLGIGLGGAAVVAAGVGAYFGFASSSARGLITNATRDSTGALTSLTQRQAEAADRRARDSAVIANTLLATAGGLLGVGVVLFVAGGSEAPVVVASGTGVSVAGRF
ncbi:MAG: uncharacterized protein H6Q89_629, partial [Myxococcaceae bacterium]|nr:uncharacterized protein [Myxococcaceae bacterium]